MATEQTPELSLYDQQRELLEKMLRVNAEAIAELTAEGERLTNAYNYITAQHDVETLCKKE